MDIIEAIRGRASTRKFLDKAVSKETISLILEAARFAPSGVNTQPWKVSVVCDDVKQKISAAYLQAYQKGEPKRMDYQYYPEEWFTPLKERRFACGMALYGALGISRDDTEARSTVWEANYRFFDAPVGLFFWIDKRLKMGSWLDNGMFIQNVMLAARGFGLETCPQAAMAEYPDLARDILGVSEEYLCICGMALGFANYDDPINSYRTEREDISNFTDFHGLD